MQHQTTLRNLTSVDRIPSKDNTEVSRDLMDTKTLVGWSGLSASFWNNARCSGHGPKFLKMGRRVVYHRSDVEEWLSSIKRASTKDIPRSDAE
jgi:predicted DNA-binding transcriptional regulator AlpA